MFKKLIAKIKKTVKSRSKPDSKEYSSRFLKFYYLNQKRLNGERRSIYKEHKKLGLCVRCHRKALSGIIFCEFHQKRQKQYNFNARNKR